MIRKINAKELFRICKEQKYIDDDITYQQFYYITRDFNKKLISLIIEGYKYESKLGIFEVQKRERNANNIINWDLSLKKKQEIINAGRVPYNKKDAPNGEFWFVYFTDSIHYAVKWIRTFTFWSFDLASIPKKLLGRTVKVKKETQTEFYASFVKNNIIPSNNFKDSKNLQATR